MKMLQKLLVLLFMFGTTQIAKADIYEDVATYLREGNAKMIANLFESSVELNIEGKEGFYSKAQAEIILKNFFQKHPVKTYVPVHKGKGEGIKYAIGKLTTTNGATYKVYFVLKEKDGKFQISQLVFETE